MQVLRWLLVFVVMAQGAGAATTPKATSGPPAVSTKRPNILLITLDTTRADRMGFLGSKAGLTPNLDTLARSSVVFERAYAQVPLTTPSHANIFTGTYPQFDHLTYMGQPLAADLPYLPDLLHQRGYRTAAFVGSFIIDSKNLVAAGFGRGFDTYDANFHNRKKGEDRYLSIERRADTVVSHALAWLDAHRGGPFFMWVHCYDPHAPYDPPEPYKTRYAASPYDGEIAYTDQAMGKLIAGLQARGLYDGALIALMADHGEALGEHGEKHHGIFLYDETVHVPLLFKLPKQRFAGIHVEGRARLVDVAPTILQEEGIPVPKAMQGGSLLNLMKAAASATGAAVAPANPDRPAYAESDYAHRAFGWSALRAWRTGKYLYVDAPERELYDQTTDPQAAHNLAADSKAVADTMQSQVNLFRSQTTSADTKRVSLSPEESEILRALGYVGTDAAPNAEGEERGADPKGKTDIAYLMDEALSALQEDDFQAAIPTLEQVIHDEPNTALAYLELGRAYVNLKDYQKALPLLRTAVEKLPDDTLARYKLSEALVKTGDWIGAVPQLEVVVARSPKSPEMRFDLAVAYERTAQIPAAVKEFRSTLELDPSHFRANLLLGRLLGMQGSNTEALPYLRKAAKLQPESREAHMFLANVYAALGQAANAQRERAEAERGKPYENP
jgi:arylsulfatase A-like enzyme/Tfp pilus assembly protein PilF